MERKGVGHREKRKPSGAAVMRPEPTAGLFSIKGDVSLYRHDAHAIVTSCHVTPGLFSPTCPTTSRKPGTAVSMCF